MNKLLIGKAKKMLAENYVFETNEKASKADIEFAKKYHQDLIKKPNVIKEFPEDFEFEEGAEQPEILLEQNEMFCGHCGIELKLPAKEKKKAICKEGHLFMKDDKFVIGFCPSHSGNLYYHEVQEEVK